MRPRSLSRRLALQYLHMVDYCGAENVEPLGEFLAAHTDEEEVTSFANEVVSLVCDSREKIDAAITAAAENWRIERLGAIERNAIRIGYAELLADKTPPKVVLDEAVRLAKTFGSKDSPGFVNGILDRLLKEFTEAPKDTENQA